ncbi:MAG: ATP-binding protein [Bryobacterales bacterium]|nr:ATP-binding protein [Bryobacterales bacterium]
MSLRPERRFRLRYEDRVALLVALSGAPALVCALVFVWFWDQPAHVRWTVAIAIVLPWAAFAAASRDRVIRSFQTLSNILAGLREGDYSIRGRGGNPNDVLSEVMFEVNQLVDILRTQRLGAVEATALLHRVMDVIEVAIFTFDPNDRLRFINRAGQELLAQTEPELLGRTAADLGLEECIESTGDRTMELRFPAAAGRWGVSTTVFREEGLQHRLLAVQDLTRALREEEIATWKRLVRVLGHELNNSLTPIKSIAGSIQTLVKREPPPPDWKDDALHGLNIIATRADALSRFMSQYARLAKLPSPAFGLVEVPSMIRRVAALETRLPVRVEPGPEMRILADSDQLEQVLINLIRNAVDASSETGGHVHVCWTVVEESGTGERMVLRVLDEGYGVANLGNLFVPFFTTKPGGSGIGLVLCRQIAEAHGGSLTLANRTDRSGCEARLDIPIKPPAAVSPSAETVARVSS